MHHARMPSPGLIHYNYREIVQACARDNGFFPVLGRASSKTNCEATPLAFQFTKSSFNYYARLAAIVIEKFVVWIICVSVASQKPWEEWIRSIAVYVIASVSKIAHCACVEGGK